MFAISPEKHLLLERLYNRLSWPLKNIFQWIYIVICPFLKIWNPRTQACNIFMSFKTTCQFYPYVPSKLSQEEFTLAAFRIWSKLNYMWKQYGNKYHHITHICQLQDEEKITFYDILDFFLNMLSGTMPQKSVYDVLGPVTWSFNDLQHQDKSTNNFLEYSMYQFAPTNVITIAMSSHEKKTWVDKLDRFAFPLLSMGIFSQACYITTH